MTPICSKGIGKVIAIGICAAVVLVVVYVVVGDVTAWWYIHSGYRVMVYGLVRSVCVQALRRDTNDVFPIHCVIDTR